ncbi:DEAD/DEAH box helicase [Staphylococcus aureus]|uniref:DEAD/DEAH box helicase n=1 Tax=Staphylococcus aureus TaxID=1280 RepID=UPI00301C82DB
MSRLLNDFNQSLHKGFIDKDISHKGNYTPKLLVNNKNEKVLSTIIDELQKCETFYFSVAFITESGLASLKAQLLDLSNKGVKGKILTSNYLGFNSPKMYGELLKLKNVEVRLTDIAGFHAKGYIFEHKDYSSMVIGSSNLTSNALKVNYEHNVLLSTMKNGDLVDSVKNEFDLLWQKSIPLTEQWINSYKESFEYRSLEKLAEVEQTQMLLADKVKKSVEIVPNLMQAEALRSLKAIRDKAKDKALIISATGTGKTILCALDVREVNPNKFLFIVHNEGILNRAKEEFKKVLPIKNDSDFGLLTGKHRDVDAKYLFATIQTLSRDDNFKQFDENEFDYIVFDEAHRSAASTYQRVFNYFKPKFMLGMTATPERSDELSIFELFDYNIAYEIRLQAALESDILCPFHYFGVTDYVHQGIKEDDVTKLRYLTSDERVNYIIQKTDYYGYSGEILQGLIFVSSKKEAYDLADKLSSKGIKSVALTGDDSVNYRQIVIEKLKEGKINYIITVDLFNEGIDIPEVNQVVMLRPTESSIIFIQQLGRGLRKSANKEYVTVIDFIGNYKTNYLIPIALSGDQSQNKDNYKKFLTNNDSINGVSTINFEEVAKKQIYNSLDAVSLNQNKLILKAYEEVENRLGHMPLLMDFIQQHSIDPSVIFSKFSNYYEFLVRYKKIDTLLTENESKNLVFFSRQIAPGLKRIDSLVLEELLKNELKNKMLNEVKVITEDDIDTSLRILDFSFYNAGIEKIYGSPIIECNERMIRLSDAFTNALSNQTFKIFLEDLIELSKYNNEKYQKGKNGLILYNKYSREDFSKIFNWNKNGSSVIMGYMIRSQEMPIFITYDKHEDISDSTKYEDEFLSQDELKWFTKSNRTLKSKEVQKILSHRAKGIKMYIFVQKKDDDGIYFYYLGTAGYIEGSEKQDKMPNGSNVVTMDLALDKAVRDDIYRYITN